MQKIIYIALICLFGMGVRVNAQELYGNAEALKDSLQKANSYAQEGKLSEAVSAYEYVLSGGYHNASVYYNLGYCYYKQGKTGKAILNLERAKRLAPADEDIEHNLLLVYSHTDQLQEIEKNFMSEWYDGLCSKTDSDGWAMICIMLFAVAIVVLAVFVFVQNITMRKVSFFVCLFLMMLAAFAFGVSKDLRDSQTDSMAAVIMIPSVNLQTSPDKNGAQMAVLHEGTFVEVLNTINEWVEVRLKDGKVGWLKQTEIEKI